MNDEFVHPPLSLTESVAFCRERFEREREWGEERGGGEGKKKERERERRWVSLLPLFFFFFKDPKAKTLNRDSRTQNRKELKHVKLLRLGAIYTRDVSAVQRQ